MFLHYYNNFGRKYANLHKNILKYYLILLLFEFYCLKLAQSFIYMLRSYKRKDFSPVSALNITLS